MNPTHNHHIGAMVRRLRKAKGMTQEELATASGISRGTVANVEDALASPNIDTLAALAAGLGAELEVKII